MREALAARSDRDFIASAPERRAPRRRAAAPPTSRALTHHPRRVIAVVLLSTCAGLIVWNALMRQQARHPAPLFNHAALSPQQARLAPPPPRPAAIETPSAQPVEPTTVSPPKPPARSAITDLIRAGGEPPPAQSRSVPAPVQPVALAPPARQALTHDPIADIIRMGGPVPTPPGHVGRGDAADLTLAGQRALAKLGYALKADGVMGSGTRQAIERFEQDRRLPVTGEFNARTARELAAASGIAVP